MSSGQGQMLLMCSNVKDQMQVAKYPCNIFFIFCTPGIVHETLQQYCVQIILCTTISGLDTRFNLAIASKLQHVQALNHLYIYTCTCNFHQQIMNLRTTSQTLSRIITLWYTTRRSTVAAYTKEFTVKYHILRCLFSTKLFLKNRPVVVSDNKQHIFSEYPQIFLLHVQIRDIVRCLKHQLLPVMNFVK